MTLALQIILLVAAICMTVFILRSIKKSKMRIEDSIFWAFITLLILLLAVFPQIGSFFSNLMGFLSPVNFIFMFFIFVLLMKSYHSTRQVSELETKVRELSEQIALDRLDHYERSNRGK